MFLIVTKSVSLGSELQNEKSFLASKTRKLPVILNENDLKFVTENVTIDNVSKNNTFILKVSGVISEKFWVF